MFVVSPILLFGLWKLGYLFMPLLAAVIGAINYHVYEIAQDNRFDLQPLHLDYFQKLYVKTHCRLSTWIFGIMLAYIIYRHRETGRRLSMVRLHSYDMYCEPLHTYLYGEIYNPRGENNVSNSVSS